MSSDNGHEGTQIDTGPEDSQRRHRQILKRDATFIELAGGLWSAMLFAASALLEAHHKVACELLFLGAFVTSAFVVYIHWRHRRNGKQKIVWRVIAPLALVHVVCLVAAGSAYILDPSPPPPFHIEGSAALILDPPSNTKMTAFVVASTGPDGTILRPVQRIQYLFLANNSNSKRMVLRYGLAVETGKGWFGPLWTDLCRVDIRGKRLIQMTDDSQSATGREISTTNSLDRGLVNQMLGSGEQRSGWSLWVCPPDKQDACGHGAKRMRLTLYDSEGVTSHYILPANSKADMLDSELIFSPAITDLTDAKWDPNRLCD